MLMPRLNFYIPYNRALTIAAAMLEPPFLPLATIRGMSEVLSDFLSFQISSFASTTFTKPTGTAMIPAGLRFSSRMSRSNSIKAVGALPMAKMMLESEAVDLFLAFTVLSDEMAINLSDSS